MRYSLSDDVFTSASVLFMVTRADREIRNGHRGVIIWLTGLPGSGKSTLAYGVEERLFRSGYQTVVLDGDLLRKGVCSDLGYSAWDRHENVRRVGEIAKLFLEAGTIVLVALISPYRIDRACARALVAREDFIEVFCDAPLEICEARDPKGLYRRARSGEIANMTGIGAPYEPPENPELVLDTGFSDPNVCIRQIICEIQKRGIVTEGSVAFFDQGSSSL